MLGYIPFRNKIGNEAGDEFDNSKFWIRRFVSNVEFTHVEVNWQVIRMGNS